MVLKICSSFTFFSIQSLYHPHIFFEKKEITLKKNQFIKKLIIFYVLKIITIFTTATDD